MFLRCLLACAAVLTSCATARPLSAPSASDCSTGAGFDVLDHQVELSVTLSPPSLHGEGLLRLRARAAAEVAVLDAHELRVVEASLGGEATPFFADDHHLCVRLPRKLSPGEEVTLQLRWDARVDRDTPKFSASQAWAGYLTSAWMPTVQDPAQRATLTLTVHTPEGLRVGASGQRRSPNTFRVDRPVPPFLFAFVVGDFDETVLDADGVRLRALGPRGVSVKAALETTAAALRFLRERTGHAYPEAEYQEVFVAGDAAQEAAGLALLSASSLDDLAANPADDWLFTHELAHQWFGVLIPCADFSDFWLNEGFATFAVAAFKEQRQGRSAYDAEVAIWRARSDKVRAQGRDAPISMSPPGTPRRALREDQLQARGVTYFRGALVLDTLRETLGEAAFWAGLRHYVVARQGRSAVTEDLRQALEQASGRDLRDFFERWVYTSAPTLGTPRP